MPINSNLLTLTLQAGLPSGNCLVSGTAKQQGKRVKSDAAHLHLGILCLVRPRLHFPVPRCLISSLQACLSCLCIHDCKTSAYHFNIKEKWQACKAPDLSR